MPRIAKQEPHKKQRGLFEYGSYWIDTISNSKNLYYYWYDRSTGKNRHRTLGTNNLDEGKEKLIALVKSSGQDQTATDQDPHLVVVLNCYLKHAPLQQKSWGGSPKALAEALTAVDVTVTVSGFDPVFQGFLFEYFHALNRAPNSIASAMRLASAAIRWVSKWGRRYNLRIGTRQTVISNVEEICDYLNLPYPEPQNQHPDTDGMAKMIAAAADDELLRRWFLLTLTWACRPGHTLLTK